MRSIATHFAYTLNGLALDRAGLLYAAGDSAIEVFYPTGRLVRRIPTARPVLSVAVADDGSVYTGHQGEIEVFTADGKAIRTWREPNLLGKVTQIGFFQNNIFVGDVFDRSIRRFDRHGKFQNNIGKDNPLGGLAVPNGIVSFSIDTQGIIHAANPGKHRVEKYTMEGALQGHIGRFDGIDPAGFTGCCNPTNVAVVPNAIYVTEKANPRAKVYDAAGKLGAVIADKVFDPNCKNMSIAADRQSRVYVADTVKRSIFVVQASACRVGIPLDASSEAPCS